MNIFAFDRCPMQSASWLDDIRKNKMILESAQMLSTAVRMLDPDTNLSVYKLAYINHPCSKWARASRDNFKWLLSHMSWLYNQAVMLLPVLFLNYSSMQRMDIFLVMS